MEYDLSGRTILEIPESSQLEELLACILPVFPSLRALEPDLVVQAMYSPSTELLQSLRWKIRNTPDSPHMRRGNGGYLAPVGSARFGFFGHRIRVSRGLEIRPQIGSVIFFICKKRTRFFLLTDSRNSYPFAVGLLDTAFGKIHKAFGLLPVGGSFSKLETRCAILCHRPNEIADYVLPPRVKRKALAENEIVKTTQS